MCRVSSDDFYLVFSDYPCALAVAQVDVFSCEGEGLLVFVGPACYFVILEVVGPLVAGLVYGGVAPGEGFVGYAAEAGVASFAGVDVDDADALNGAAGLADGLDAHLSAHESRLPGGDAVVDVDGKNAYKEESEKDLRSPRSPLPTSP